MVGGHEVTFEVLGGVIDQETGAEGAAAGGDHCDRTDLVSPTVHLGIPVGRGADYIKVARSGGDGVRAPKAA